MMGSRTVCFFTHRSKMSSFVTGRRIKSFAPTLNIVPTLSMVMSFVIATTSCTCGGTKKEEEEEEGGRRRVRKEREHVLVNIMK